MLWQSLLLNPQGGTFARANMVTSEPHLLSLEAVSVTRGTRKVISGLSLQVSSGDILALTGPNGSGKSTLVEAIAGLLPLQSGSILRTESPFGLTLQQDAICGDEIVSERLALALRVCGAVGSEKELALLKRWQMQHRASDRIAHLSGGMRRRVAVIQGLLPAYSSGKPRLCLLDEPSEGLDDESVNTLISDLVSLAARGHAFVIATHDARLAACANRRLELTEDDITEHGITKDGSTDLAITETQDEASGTLPKSTQMQLPEPLENTKPDYGAERAWEMGLGVRTRLPYLTRGLPLLATLLVIAGLSNNGEIPEGMWFGGLVMLPGFLAAMTPPAELRFHAEERAGDWWRAVGGGPRVPHGMPVEWILIVLSPLLGIAALGESDILNSDNILAALALGIGLLTVMLANNSVYSLAARLPRDSAVFVPLLSLILIWPLLIMTELASSLLALEIALLAALPSLALAVGIPLIIFILTPVLMEK